MLHGPEVANKLGEAFTSYSTLDPTARALHSAISPSERPALGLGVDGRRKQHLRQLEHVLDLLGSCLNLHVPIPASLCKVLHADSSGILIPNHKALKSTKDLSYMACLGGTYSRQKPKLC